MAGNFEIEYEVNTDVPEALRHTRQGTGRLVERFTTDIAEYAKNVARSRAPRRGDIRRKGGPTTFSNERQPIAAEMPGNLARSIVVPVPARKRGDGYVATVTHDEYSAPYFRFVHEGTGPKVVPFTETFGFRLMFFPETRRGAPKRFWAGNFFRGNPAQPYMDEAVAVTEATIIPFRAARLEQDIAKMFDDYVPKRGRKR